MQERLREWFDIPERALGFRGTALLLFALAYVGVGLSIPNQPPTSTVLYDSLIPVSTRVAFWCLCALFGIFAVFYRKPLWQGRGFGVLLLPAGERFTSYVGGMIFDVHPLRWLAGAAIYFILTAVLLLIAAWPEPVPPKKKVR